MNKDSKVAVAVFGALGALLVLLLIAATQVVPGKRIKDYPHTNRAPDEAVFIMEHTNRAGPGPTATNLHISALELLQQGTNGLATTGFVNTVGTTVSNGAVNFTVNYVTNTSNALSLSISNTSNFLATSSIDVKTNQTLMILQSVPNSGSQWYVGTNGTPQTNFARSGFEMHLPKQSFRGGTLGNVGLDNHHTIPVSNYWDEANIQVFSWCFGSNSLVNARNSTIAGGSRNLIYTNAAASFIGGGSNNVIRTNAYGSVICGGGFGSGGNVGNIIHVNSHLSFIGGGSEHHIHGGGQHNTIGGGQNQEINNQSTHGFIGGGLGNSIIHSGSGAIGAAVVGGSQNSARGDYSFIGGGFQNITVGSGSSYSTIAGGQGNNIGTAVASPATHVFIGGGLGNAVSAEGDYAVISGGRGNTMAGNNTNSVIGGGRFNSLGAGEQFGMILGGQSNTVNGTDSFVAGGSRNRVTADGAGALGQNVTNGTANSTMVSELISYNTPAVIAGAGSGSTNYTLQLTSPEMVLGSSNVNIVAAMGWIDGKTHKWGVTITNLSGDNWGFSFQQTSNRVKWQSWMYGTNAPSVLTNNTALRITGTSTGTNTLAEYKYFSPAL